MGASASAVRTLGACLVAASAAAADDLVVSGLGGVFRFELPSGNSLGAFTTGRTVGFPGGVAIGPGGDLFVGDQVSSEILRFDGRSGAFEGVFVSTFSGGLSTPEGVEFGPGGHLYVANHDTPGAVLRFDGISGAFIGVFASGGGLSYPTDMQFHNGRLYVVSGQTNQVLRFDAASGQFIDVFVSTTAVTFATGLAFGSDGHLYLAGYISNNVARFNGVTGVFIDEFVDPLGGLEGPSDIDFGPDGDLYATGTATDTVLRFDGTSGALVDALTDPGLFLPWYLAFREGCMPDCDQSTGPGMLDIFDFLCFQNRYVALDPYACDCDLSTGPRVCDIFDFLCFQNAFATGCP